MTDPGRPKVFVSYHHADQTEAEAFVRRFESVFIPKVIGVSDADDFIDSTDPDYVMRRIREKYLADSTVTIVLLGRCTWARRYVDWEIASTLRNDPVNKRSGLMAITLPSVVALSKQLPVRLADNIKDDQGYARWWKYPTSDASLRSCLDIALQARATIVPVNGRALKQHNSPC